MSDILPVVKVKHKIFNKEMVINRKDFDKEIHELLDKKTKTSSKASEEDEAKKKAEEEEAKLKALMGGK